MSGSFFERRPSTSLRFAPVAATLSGSLTGLQDFSLDSITGFAGLWNAE